LLNVQRRYREYSLLLTALRFQFRRELTQQQHELEVGSLAEQRHQQEMEEHGALMAWNLEENKKAILRSWKKRLHSSRERRSPDSRRRRTCRVSRRGRRRW
ncbi:unnamed protein product, partial [Staurois parvus]